MSFLICFYLLFWTGSFCTLLYNVIGSDFFEIILRFELSIRGTFKGVFRRLSECKSEVYSRGLCHFKPDLQLLFGFSFPQNDVPKLVLVTTLFSKWNYLNW